MAATSAETIPPPQTNGIATVDDGLDDEEKNKMRPADIDADMREMERRKRVELIMNSRLFREELERIIETQMKDGNNSDGLLQQISDMVGSRYKSHVFRNTNCVVPINDIRGVDAMAYVKGEKILRCKLAALFRLIDLYGWSQNIYNNVTARLSQQEEHFLVNPYGLLYNEITASSLVKVDMQGNVIESGTTNFTVNVAGFQLHAAIYSARPDLKCIVHIHTPSVLAVSSLKDGLLPLCQESAVIGEVSHHSYADIPTEPQELEKITRNLGPNNKVIFLTNHGALCCGETIEETFFNAYNMVTACETQLKVLPMGKDNLVFLSEETRKSMYEASRKMPETVAAPANLSSAAAEKRWRVGGIEYEALMRMLDNSGFRTGYVYRQPLIKGDLPRTRNDVEVPPAVSSLGYLLEEEEQYKLGAYRRLFGTKGNERIRWLNSPNVYQKVEILESGTTDPKKITKWVGPNNEEWVAEGSPSHTSTPVKIENALQFVPKNTNPKEFKKLQQQIKDNRRADKITSGPQSHILEGVSWEEAKKLQDANVSGTNDQVILVGAASKGIIQREFQHNATVYKTPYAKNPFDAVTDEELENYKKDINRKQYGDSYYDGDESDAFSATLPPPSGKNATGVASETEDDSLANDVKIIQVQKSIAPKESRAEVVLSDDAFVGMLFTRMWELRKLKPVSIRIDEVKLSSCRFLASCFFPNPPCVGKYDESDDSFVYIDKNGVLTIDYVSEIPSKNSFCNNDDINGVICTNSPSFATMPMVYGFDSSEVEYTTVIELPQRKHDEEIKPRSPPDFASVTTTEDEDEDVNSELGENDMENTSSLTSLTSCIGIEYEDVRPPKMECIPSFENLLNSAMSTSVFAASDISNDDVTVIQCNETPEIDENNDRIDDASITPSHFSDDESDACSSTSSLPGFLVNDEDEENEICTGSMTMEHRTYCKLSDLDYSDSVSSMSNEECITSFRGSRDLSFKTELPVIYEEENEDSICGVTSIDERTSRPEPSPIHSPIAQHSNSDITPTNNRYRDADTILLSPESSHRSFLENVCTSPNKSQVYTDHPELQGVDCGTETSSSLVEITTQSHSGSDAMINIIDETSISDTTSRIDSALPPSEEEHLVSSLEYESHYPDGGYFNNEYSEDEAIAMEFDIDKQNEVISNEFQNVANTSNTTTITDPNLTHLQEETNTSDNDNKCQPPAVHVPQLLPTNEFNIQLVHYDSREQSSPSSSDSNSQEIVVMPIAEDLSHLKKYFTEELSNSDKLSISTSDTQSNSMTGKFLHGEHSSANINENSLESFKQVVRQLYSLSLSIVSLENEDAAGIDVLEKYDENTDNNDCYEDNDKESLRYSDNTSSDKSENEASRRKSSREDCDEDYFTATTLSNFESYETACDGFHGEVAVENEQATTQEHSVENFGSDFHENTNYHANLNSEEVLSNIDAIRHATNEILNVQTIFSTNEARLYDDNNNNYEVQDMHESSLHTCNNRFICDTDSYTARQYVNDPIEEENFSITVSCLNKIIHPAENFNIFSGHNIAQDFEENDSDMKVVLKNAENAAEFEHMPSSSIYRQGIADTLIRIHNFAEHLHNILKNLYDGTDITETNIKASVNNDTEEDCSLNSKEGFECTIVDNPSLISDKNAALIISEQNVFYEDSNSPEMNNNLICVIRDFGEVNNTEMTSDNENAKKCSIQTEIECVLTNVADAILQCSDSNGVIDIPKVFLSTSINSNSEITEAFNFENNLVLSCEEVAVDNLSTISNVYEDVYDECSSPLIKSDQNIFFEDHIQNYNVLLENNNYNLITSISESHDMSNVEETISITSNLKQCSMRAEAECDLTSATDTISESCDFNDGTDVTKIVLNMPVNSNIEKTEAFNFENDIVSRCTTKIISTEEDCSLKLEKDAKDVDNLSEISSEYKDSSNEDIALIETDRSSVFSEECLIENDYISSEINDNNLTNDRLDSIKASGTSTLKQFFMRAEAEYDLTNSPDTILENCNFNDETDIQKIIPVNSNTETTKGFNFENDIASCCIPKIVDTVDVEQDRTLNLEKGAENIDNLSVISIEFKDTCNEDITLIEPDQNFLFSENDIIKNDFISSEISKYNLTNVIPDSIEASCIEPTSGASNLKKCFLQAEPEYISTSTTNTDVVSLGVSLSSNSNNLSLCCEENKTFVVSERSKEKDFESDIQKETNLHEHNFIKTTEILSDDIMIGVTNSPPDLTTQESEIHCISNEFETISSDTVKFIENSSRNDSINNHVTNDNDAIIGSDELLRVEEISANCEPISKAMDGNIDALVINNVEDALDDNTFNKATESLSNDENKDNVFNSTQNHITQESEVIHILNEFENTSADTIKWIGNDFTFNHTTNDNDVITKNELHVDEINTKGQLISNATDDNIVVSLTNDIGCPLGDDENQHINYSDSETIPLEKSTSSSIENLTHMSREESENSFSPDSIERCCSSVDSEHARNQFTSTTTVVKMSEECMDDFADSKILNIINENLHTDVTTHKIYNFEPVSSLPLQKVEDGKEPVSSLHRNDDNQQNIENDETHENSQKIPSNHCTNDDDSSLDFSLKLRLRIEWNGGTFGYQNDSSEDSNSSPITSKTDDDDDDDDSAEYKTTLLNNSSSYAYIITKEEEDNRRNYFKFVLKDFKQNYPKFIPYSDFSPRVKLPPSERSKRAASVAKESSSSSSFSWIRNKAAATTNKMRGGSSKIENRACSTFSEMMSSDKTRSSFFVKCDGRKCSSAPTTPILRAKNKFNCKNFPTMNHFANNFFNLQTSTPKQNVNVFNKNRMSIRTSLEEFELIESFFDENIK